MNQWKDDVREGSRAARSIGWRAAMWIVVAVIFFGLLGVGVWGFKVATSDVKGQGDAVQTKNSASNRIRAQEEYVQKFNDVLVADQRVTAMFNAEQADPSTINQTNYNGAVNFCIQLVGDYNKLIDKYTSADFIPEGYPEKIDSLNTDTDCKENTQ